jgi:citrate lyase subunit beta/citryl-CoA lyase
MITGLRRSLLYVPCDNEKMIQKAARVSADMLLLNLEDGVAPAYKEQARSQAVRALTSIDFGRREVVVRINSLATELGKEDLAAVLVCRPDGICLPKVESPEQVRFAAQILSAMEEAHGLAAGATRIHAMIESAAGILSSREIGASSDRMASLIFGSADYCADVRCLAGPERQELALALQFLVTGARAASIAAVDAPCFEIRNELRLRQEAGQGRRIGFDGKSALHPGQLPAINECFDVTDEEIRWAEKVLAELNRAEIRGRALSTLEGQLIDNPHRTAAEHILERARLACLFRSLP